MTRTGKIARLPHEIREQLNHRLRDGHQAKSVLSWLNALPEVRSVLKSEFSGRPVSPVNLTEWKNGGYRDWLVRQHALELIRNLDDEHGLGDKSPKGAFTPRFSHWVALHLAATAQAVLAVQEDPEIRWARLGQVC